MKNILIALAMMLLPLIVSAQRTIENPVIGSKGIGTLSLGIEKVVLQKDMTKLYMVYYHGGEFNMNINTRLVANGKEYKVQSAEGIGLSGPNIKKPQGEQSRFVLNFPPLDKEVDRFDFIEDYCPQCFMIFDVALTDQAAAEIKAAHAANDIPDAVKNYAANIKDSGGNLETEEFAMGTAIIKGRIYNYDQRVFRGLLDKLTASAHITSPFTNEQTQFATKINADMTFELKVPVCVKNQMVLFRMLPFFNGYILASGGKTVEVNFDINDIFSRLGNPEGPRIPPYFAGANADINYAVYKADATRFTERMIYNPEAQKLIANMTMPQYKDYILEGHIRYCQQIDTMRITRRAKELLKIEDKCNAANYLSMGEGIIERAYRQTNGKDNREPIPEFQRPGITEDYFDYIKRLDLDNVMMFYADNFGNSINGWNIHFREYWQQFKSYDEILELIAKAWENIPTTQKVSKKEKALVASIAQKLRNSDTTLTPEERDFEIKYSQAAQKFIDDEQRKHKLSVETKINNFVGDGCFKDFITLQGYCQPLGRNAAVPDSIVAEIEKMHNPFYAQYVKAQNAVVAANVDAEKNRGGYFLHKTGDSEGDSLLVELVKDFKGKVVFIDFWNTWCGACRQAIKDMRPMEESYEGKDVVFLFIVDESSPEKEYNSMIPSIKGHHFRLSSTQASSLMSKWGFSGFPSYVIVGKDGIVKDYHTGFHGVDYYKQKIEEELNK